MNVGKIKWFGGYNYKKDCVNSYGFIADLTMKKDIFFHKKGIRRDSALFFYDNDDFSEYTEQYVIYDIKENDNKICAYNVRLFIELTQTEFNKLDDSFKVLNELKDILIGLFPSYYLTNNIEDYFLHLNSKKVMNLLVERDLSQFFPESLPISLTKYIANGNKLLSSDFLNIFDWSKEKFSDVVKLCETLYNKKISIAGIYNKVRSLIIEYPQYITFDDMLLLINYGYLPSDEDFERLILNVYDEKSISILCDALPIEYIINNEQCLNYISCNKFKECLLSIDWKNDSLNYILQYEELLAKLDADLFPEISILLCQSMQECNKLFNQNWWRFFTNSFKIRILIFSSNFKENFLFYRDSIKKNILEFEQNNKECNIFYALLFFYSILGVNTRAEKQQKFITGHEKLIKAIVESVMHPINQATFKRVFWNLFCAF